jgi:hypothetical protein
MLVDAAAKAWVTAMDTLKERTGAGERMFPDAFVNDLWRPAAIRLGMKYLPDSVGGDLADVVTVALPPVTTVVALRKAPKVAKPADDRAPANPVAADVPPTGSAPSAATTRDVRQRIQRETAPDMPRGAVF